MTSQQWALVGAGAGLSVVCCLIWLFTSVFVPLPFIVARQVLTKLRLWPAGFGYYVAMPATLLLMLLAIYLMYLALGSWRELTSPLWISVAAGAPLCWFWIGIIEINNRRDDAAVQRALWKAAIGAVLTASLFVSAFFLPSWNDLASGAPAALWRILYKG